MKKHQRLRAFNKLILNPLMRTFAGKRYAPLALIHHVGRRSGKLFDTPLIVEPVRGGFVIALTYGADVDWYRNLVAARGGALSWHARQYTVGKPEAMNSNAGISLFPLPLRIILRLNHTEDFVQVKYTAVVRAP